MSGTRAERGPVSGRIRFVPDMLNYSLLIYFLLFAPEGVFEKSGGFM